MKGPDRRVVPVNDEGGELHLIPEELAGKPGIWLGLQLARGLIYPPLWLSRSCLRQLATALGDVLGYWGPSDEEEREGEREEERDADPQGTD